ncbi:MAG TPA: ECF-type sigma factor [Woeseiaceae bacterium]|jgi:RNA polymerase sigma factor (TIGR02999 family)|nr:ECF-type sigma factor [Woeseiaceae bacterium]
MDDDVQQTVERLLQELEHGRREAFDELFPYVYGELSEIAHRIRQRRRGDHTLNTTALIHEAYLKLVDQSRISATSRAHFLALAAKAMRYILVNYARDRRALKRGSEVLPFDEHRFTPGEVGLLAHHAEALVALDEAMAQLERA